ncbi:MAG: hypothetical protein ACWA44_02600 [Thiotrichales bacterium]
MKHELTPELKDKLLAKGVPASTVYNWKDGVPDHAVTCKRWGWTKPAELQEIREKLQHPMIYGSRFARDRHFSASITGGRAERIRLDYYDEIVDAFSLFKGDIQKTIDDGSTEAITKFCLDERIKSRVLLEAAEDYQKAYDRIRKGGQLTRSQAKAVLLRLKAEIGKF